jgi:hypothetical protein
MGHYCARFNWIDADIFTVFQGKTTMIASSSMFSTEKV